MSKTVLFLHGLESGPQGRKARYLSQAGFTVVSHQMPCGRHHLARDPVAILAASSAATLLVGSTFRKGLLGFTIAACGLAGAAPFAMSRVMRSVLRRSIAVQTHALATHPIDVVVGSSFGGAVALDLLFCGAWSGSTVLLCPAHERVAQRAWLPVPPSLASLPESVQSRIVVVHGRGDETVPVTHSEKLVAQSRAKLVLVEDDHRLSATATPEGLASWIAMTTAAATSS